MCFSLFKSTQPENRHLSRRHDYCAQRAFRFRAPPLPWLLPSSLERQKKVLRVAGLPMVGGAGRHLDVLSHLRSSQADRLFCFKAQLRQDLALEHTPPPVEDSHINTDNCAILSYLWL